MNRPVAAIRAGIVTAALVSTVALAVAPARASVGTAVAAAACGTAPVPVAHRGGTEFHTENTVLAFRSAGEAGVTEWELDVRFDRLGTPLVLHDADVDRVSPAKGELVALDGTTTPIPTDDGQYIPRLREVLAEAQVLDSHVLVELKVRPSATQWDAVIAAIDETVGRTGVTMISFDRTIVLEAQTKVPGAPTGLIHQAGYLSAEQVLHYGGYFIKHYKAYSAARAAEWHAAGIRLYAWNLNDQKDWSQLSKLPIDVISTDRPTAYLAWQKKGCPAG